MIALDPEERAEYERLRAHYGGSPAFGDSPTLAAMARARVGRRREQQAGLLRQLARALKLSWLDRITLYGASRVIARKGVPMVSRMIGNWRTSLAAFIVALGVYLQGNGGKLPETAAEWKIALLAAAIQAFGLVGKDASVGSAPGAKGSAHLLALPLAALIALCALGCSGGGDDSASCDVVATEEVSGTIIAQCADGSVCIGSSCADNAGTAGDVDNRPNSGNTTDSGNTSSTSDTTTTTNNPPAEGTS